MTPDQLAATEVWLNHLGCDPKRAQQLFDEMGPLWGQRRALLLTTSFGGEAQTEAQVEGRREGKGELNPSA